MASWQEVQHPPMAFVGGEPCLDLVNTADWTPGGPENERLATYERWLEWCAAAGVTTEVETRRLTEDGRRRPAPAGAALAEVGEVRDLLRRLFTALAVGGIADEEVTELNGRLNKALRRLELAPGAATSAPRPLVWRWRGSENDLAWPLWRILWGAAHLLTSQEAERLRACAGEGCGWVFLDRSRNGLRRWCQMETCGTRAKSRRRAARRRRPPGSGQRGRERG